MLVVLAQSSTGLIERWWVSHLGTEALAGMALVFPVFMITQMLSGDAMGGGIASAIARALIAVGGGWAVLRLTGSLTWLFAALNVALIVYGLTLVAAVASGAWFRARR